MMKNVTTKAPAYKLQVEIDEFPPDPRTDYDNFGKMVCWHSRYDLGDKHDFSEPSDFLKQCVRDTLSADEVIDFVKKGGCASVKLEYDRHNREWALRTHDAHFNKWFTEYTFSPKTLNHSDMAKEYILECLPINALKELADKKNVILPLYLYDHSGLSISCSHSYPYNDRWDAGQVGWIFAGHDKIKNEYGAVNEETLKQAKQLLISETETYDNYLRGECYGYVIEKDGEEVDSCCGFLGDFKEMLSEMKAGADKEYRCLFDHIDYGCMEYAEYEPGDKAAKPSIRKQLTEQAKEIKPEQKSVKRTEPELG